MNNYIFEENDRELDEFLGEFDEDEVSAIEEEMRHSLEVARQALIQNIRDANNEYLVHYGVGHDDNPPGPGSGRFPYGSGENPGQHQPYTLARQLKELKDKGLSTSEAAKYLGFVKHTKKGDIASISALRAAVSIESEQRKLYFKSEVPRLKAQGLTNQKIADMLDMSEASVRNYLKADYEIQAGKTRVIADTIKGELDKKRFIDIGAGVNYEIGCTSTKFDTAVEMLKQEGYKPYYFKVEQAGNPGHYTTLKVLGTPDSDWSEIVQDVTNDDGTVTKKQDLTKIRSITSYFQDNGDSVSVLGVERPRSISSDRIKIRYADEVGPDGYTGIQRDGIIMLRRGVDEISLGRSNYAQVRIAVDDRSYLKGMAVYADDYMFPDGCDIIVNSNKSMGTDKYKVFKDMKKIKYGEHAGEIDWDNPFGATIMDSDRELNAGGQTRFIDEDGVEKLRVVNKVNDRGSYNEWKKTISPQMLSKQPPKLVQKQLQVTIEDRKAEFDDIMTVEIPTIRKALLESFAEDCDANASHLKAKAFPGQVTNVLISMPSLGENECYTPNFPHGEKLAFVRYPHAGPQEIVEARNNLHNVEGIKTLGANAPDAIGLHPSQYQKLSGADSDGDTAVIVPLSKTNVKSLPMFQGMVGFDPNDYVDKEAEARGEKTITHQNMQTEMGKVTNLIADMGIFSAKDDEMVRAIKYSQVAIDSEKHYLNWKQAYKDLGIEELKKKYQNGGGASTLITRAKSEEHVPQRKPGYYEETDPITGKTTRTRGVNPHTGELIWEETGETYRKKHENKKGVYYTDEPRMETITKMDKARDAMELLSSQSDPHPNEVLYGQFANTLKSMANEARRIAVNTPKLERDPEATREYKPEVDSLKEKLIIALKNAPRERQAQIISDAVYKAKKESNPEISNDKAQLKKIRGQSITQARKAVGASKERIVPDEREIEAIRHRAISDTMLKQILDNADMDVIRKAFTPLTSRGVSAVMESHAKALAARGFTNADIAERLGVSASTVSKILNA